ncbi:3-keto-disaccharide hydrolase [Novipirellula aureliae]|nr:DUF1080 domain-containing protein [Novipirellula aureliae]
MNTLLRFAILPVGLIVFGLTAFAQSPDRSQSVAASQPTGEWISLFNGKDLSGWIPKIRFFKLGENHANTFRVEDGLLKVRYDGYEAFDQKFGHLFYEKPFSNYRFRVEYRFVGDQCKDGPGWATRNSGVMIHGEAPEKMEIDQRFPVSIEVQLLGGNGTDDRTTANLCTPGTNVVKDGKLYKPHIFNSTSKTYHGEQWVTVEIEVHGNRLIKHLIDGETVLEYTQPQLDPSDPMFEHLKNDPQTPKDLMLHGGSISLQSESHPIDFRKVEIMILDEVDSAADSTVAE